MKYLSSLGLADTFPRSAVWQCCWQPGDIMGPALLPLVSMCHSSTISPLFHRPTASRDLPSPLLRHPYLRSSLCLCRALFGTYALLTTYQRSAPITTHLLCYQNVLYGSLLSGIYSVSQEIISHPSCSKAKLTKPLSPYKMLQYSHLF